MPVARPPALWPGTLISSRSGIHQTRGLERRPPPSPVAAAQSPLAEPTPHACTATRSLGYRSPLVRRTITRAAHWASWHLLPTTTCAAFRPPLEKPPDHRPRDTPGTSPLASWRIGRGGRRAAVGSTLTTCPPRRAPTTLPAPEVGCRRAAPPGRTNATRMDQRLAASAAALHPPCAPSRAPRAGPPGVSSRRLLAPLRGHATHPGHHLCHHGVLAAVGAGAARRPRPSAYNLPSRPQAPPLRNLRPRSIAPWGTAPARHRPLCPCARPYHGPQTVPAGPAVLTNQSPRGGAHGARPQNGPPRTNSVGILTPCGACLRAGPSAIAARNDGSPGGGLALHRAPAAKLAAAAPPNPAAPLDGSCAPPAPPPPIGEAAVVVVAAAAAAAAASAAPADAAPVDSAADRLGRLPSGDRLRSTLRRAAPRGRGAPTQQIQGGSPVIHPQTSGGHLCTTRSRDHLRRQQTPQLGRPAHPTQTRPSRPDHRRPPPSTRSNPLDLGFLAARPRTGAS